MKLTNDQAVLARQALGSLLKCSVPVKTALKAVRLIQLLDTQIEAARVVRELILSSYRISVNVEENGLPVLSLSDEVSEEEKMVAFEEFTSSIKELMQTKGDINYTAKLQIPEGIPIPRIELEALGYFSAS